MLPNLFSDIPCSLVRKCSEFEKWLSSEYNSYWAYYNLWGVGSLFLRKGLFVGKNGNNANKQKSNADIVIISQEF